MAHHSTKDDNIRLRRAVLCGVVVALLSSLAIGVSDLQSSPPALSVVPSTMSASPTVSVDSSALPSIVPSVIPTPPSIEPPIVTAPAIPDLKLEARAGTTRLVFPSIGFDELLTPLEISYGNNGQPVLPQDIRAYLATNLGSRNCDVSGGDFIMGHTSTFTDYWGKVPFNAFKSLAAGDGGQTFAVGSHHYVAIHIIVQPKEALTTTKEFWCQPPGNVSIVTCYTQEEGGDNIIVIGRLVS